MSFIANPPFNCHLDQNMSTLDKWVVSMTGAPGTVYSNDTFNLQIQYPSQYPLKPPSVFFLSPVPRHQHVYSNGDICLNLLGTDWLPTMTTETLMVAILSMLSSAKEKKIPVDNAIRKFVFHDFPFY